MSVREFTEKVFKVVGIKLNWEGSGETETGTNSSNGKVIVRIDSNYYRPTEVEFLLGDASKAKEKLDWSPVCSLDQLVEEMVQEDLSLVS